MARRLPKIAEHINGSPQLGLRAVIEKGHYRGDRKPRGFRYITSPGKDRYGNRLKVWFQATGELVFDHNSAETYRSNDDVERWLAKWESGDRRRWNASGNTFTPGEGGRAF